MSPSRSVSQSPRTSLRFLGSMFDVLRAHLTSDPDREQFAFLLARPIETADGRLLLVQDVFLPERSDLAEQGALRVAPTRDFQAAVYVVAAQNGLAILDVHTHVADGVPAFSRTDWDEARRNARYIARRFAPPMTLGLVVFNRDVTAHAATIYDRKSATFQPIDDVQTVSTRLECRHHAAPAALSRVDDRYERQQRMPGWKQALLARLRIGIVGVGGHGAPLLQSLVSIGAGAAGWFAIVDPDVVEASNLPRIPYATPGDVGKLKVDVASEFAHKKNPATNVHAHPCSVADPAARPHLCGADVLFGCGDNDGVRLVANDIAVRCGIPLIDLGADIRITQGGVEAGGQVRVVLPGSTACLACCDAFDAGQAALDLLPEEGRTVYARRGYVIGADEPTLPSVGILNATIVQYALTSLLAVIQSGPLVRNDYLGLDWLTGRTLPACVPRRDDCPACGDRGFLGAGMPPEMTGPTGEPVWESAACAGADDDAPASCEPHPSRESNTVSLKDQL